jgi:hypothetical protein
MVGAVGAGVAILFGFWANQSENEPIRNGYRMIGDAFMEIS